tara:strand:+ start:4078 stop:4845 length:768 start_codon:yes stop_codon:yes gene_type:complete
MSYKVKYFNYSQLGSSIKNYKIAILVISASSKRWKLEKEVWKKYANSYPNINCFFIECNNNFFNFSKNKDANIMSFNCRESYIPGIYQKTINCLKSISNQYDIYIRTNLSTFIIFSQLNTFLQNIPQDIPIYTGGYIWKDVFWNAWSVNAYAQGNSIILNKLAVNKLLEHGFDKKYYNNFFLADDIVIGVCLKDSNIEILQNSYGNNVYKWNYNIPYESNLKNIKSQNYPFIRLKANKLNMYKEVSDKLLKEYYN